MHCPMQKTDDIVTACCPQPSLRKQMIANEMRDVFQDSKMVAVYHYNDLSVQDWNSMRLKLTKDDIKIRVIPSKVSSKALEHTRFRNIIPLFKGCTALAFSKTAAASHLLNYLKGDGKLQLLGGVLEDQLLTHTEFQEYANLPPVETLHQKLVATLTLSQIVLTGSLQSGPFRLSQMLDSASTTEPQ